jgi:hypothetical protein
MRNTSPYYQQPSQFVENKCLPAGTVRPWTQGELLLRTPLPQITNRVPHCAHRFYISIRDGKPECVFDPKQYLNIIETVRVSDQVTFPCGIPVIIDVVRQLFSDKSFDCGIYVDQRLSSLVSG